MLKQITVENFAVFHDITVNLYSDMTVITGESGSGKSVLINALSLINGSRAYKEMIRTGCETATVEAVFELSPLQKEQLDKVILINKEDDNLVITRTINVNQKSECRLNGKINNLSVLTEISSILLDIHGQYENQSLLNQESHINYLDLYANQELSVVLNEFNLILENYQKLIKEVSMVSGTVNERERDREIYSYQIDDIMNSGVLSHDWNEIFSRKKQMDNYENIKNRLAKSIQLLENDQFNITDNLYEAIKNIEGIYESDKIDSVVSDLFNSYYSISESIKAIYRLLDQLDFDEMEFESVNDIVNDINKAKGKYGESKDDVIIFLNELQDKLDYINNFEKIHKENLLNIQKMETRLSELQHNLTEIRQKYARQLEKSIEKELYELEMKNAKFQIQIDTVNEKNKLGFTRFEYNGNNIVEFYIATNKGSSLMPLRRIASGGEMSRIMLSLKTIIADKDNIETVIFDEIDSGISGETAKVASIKLKELSGSKQVICITHSPQIISKANHHFVITKKDQNDLTTADIVYLDTEEQRIYELAKIIDGIKVSKEGLLHAKEILKF